MIYLTDNHRSVATPRVIPTETELPMFKGGGKIMKLLPFAFVGTIVLIGLVFQMHYLMFLKENFLYF